MKNTLRVTPFVFVFVSALVAVQMFAIGDAMAAKRALIVTIGEYQPDTGWKTISSNSDLPIMQHALERQGFAIDNITHLSQERATHDGIVKAIEDHLIKPAAPGDVVVFHYSGHGQQIRDDNYDEIDGYDEALVPVDAPESPPTGYNGEKHLRDDELGALLYRLRKRVGPNGDVLVFLDSCHSGTATRGDAYPDPVRGSASPIGAPLEHDGAHRNDNDASGFLDASSQRGTGGDNPEDLAPMVVIAAENHNRLAEETTDENGGRVGALSWALSKALVDADEQTTYRDLFETVKRHTAAKHIPNSPQAEGKLDRLLFAGQAVDQNPYYRVKAMNLDEKWAELEGGALVGLLKGSEVEIHQVNTRLPQPDTLIAKGRVNHATPYTAEIAITEVVETGAESGIAFVTAQSFGSLRVNVYVDAADDSVWREKVVYTLEREAARQTSLIVLLEEKPAGLVATDASKIVLVREIRNGAPSQRGVVLETWENGQRLIPGPFKTSDPALASKLIARIERYAQNAYLRALDVQADGMEVALDLIPCETECTGLSECGGSCRCIAEGDPQDILDTGNNLSMKKGAGFGLRLRNVGSKPVYATVLDLMPDGDIASLWPLPGTSAADTKIEGGKAYRIADPNHQNELAVYLACPPFGTDMLKIIATTEPVDFGPITRGTRTRGGERGPLDVLFENSLRGMRGVAPAFAVGSISTSSVLLIVEDTE